MSQQAVLFVLKCRTHDEDLLPIYCEDCDSPICCECVSTNHSKHSLVKISTIAERKMEYMKEKLKQENLTELHSKIVENKNSLRRHYESIQQKIKAREEIVVSKVREITKQTLETAQVLYDKYNNPLESDINIIETLLKGVEMDTMSVKGCIECVLITSEIQRLYDFKRSDGQFNFDFDLPEDGKDTYITLFGEMSDVTKNNVDEGKDICTHVKFDVIYNNSYGFISKVVPLNHRRAYLIMNEKLYLCDLDAKERFKRLYYDVFDFCLMRSNEVLTISQSRAQIDRLRIDNSTVKSSCFLKSNNKSIVSVEKGTHFYAKMLNQKSNDCLNILEVDETGIVCSEQELSWPRGNIFDANSKIKTLRCQSQNILVVFEGTCSRTMYVYDIASQKSPTLLKTYQGSMGINPSSRFNPTDICIDLRGNLLITVLNDNAVHLLDNEFNLQKILMTSEDGLKNPHSIAVDCDGQVWVGCFGEIYIIDYEYFRTTDLSLRIKRK